MKTAVLGEPVYFLIFSDYIALKIIFGIFQLTLSAMEISSSHAEVAHPVYYISKRCVCQQPLFIKYDKNRDNIRKNNAIRLNTFNLFIMYNN